MEELVLFMNGLPDWAGTAPMWLIFGAIVTTLIKTWPVIMERVEMAREGRRAHAGGRIGELEALLDECRKECDRRDEIYKTEIDALKTKINNEAWQRVQSEISLVNTLVQLLPNNELKLILEALQKRSALLPSAATAVGGPFEDAKGNGGK